MEKHYVHYNMKIISSLVWWHTKFIRWRNTKLLWWGGHTNFMRCENTKFTRWRRTKFMRWENTKFKRWRRTKFMRWENTNFTRWRQTKFIDTAIHFGVILCSNCYNRWNSWSVAVWSHHSFCIWIVWHRRASADFPDIQVVLDQIKNKHTRRQFGLSKQNHQLTFSLYSSLQM